jgi:hypothetical protein
VLIVLTHRRGSVAHFNVTEHPTSAWVAQQIREALPNDCAARYLIRDRDRDRVYGEGFRDRVGETGITDVLTARRSPWHNAFAEPLMAPFGANAWTMWVVLGEKPAKDSAQLPSSTTRNRALICRSAWILGAPVPCNPPEVELLWRLRNWVACIIATDGVLRKGALENVESRAPRRTLPHGNWGLLTARRSSPNQTRGSPQPRRHQTAIPETIWRANRIQQRIMAKRRFEVSVGSFATEPLEHYVHANLSERRFLPLVHSNQEELLQPG